MSESPANTNGNPELIRRNLTIAEDRLNGFTFRQIAAKHHISYQHVGYILSDKEISQIIETGVKEAVSLIPKANTVISDCLDSKKENIKLDAAKHLHNITGISGANTAPVLQQFIQVNNINTLDPAPVKRLWYCVW